MTPMIALLTDFGNDDIYVGMMKGVIYRINPSVRVVDLTHAIDPHNVRQAAFSLLNAYRYFTPGTIFVVIVDPGVGSTRRPIAVRAGDYTFIAPDNGVLSYTLNATGQFQAIELTNAQYRLQEVSNTFHGRDIFAPAAAHLAASVPFETLGEPLDDLFPLHRPELSVSGRKVTGEIVHIDRFGNIVSSIGLMRWLNADRLSLAPVFGENTDLNLPLHALEANVIVGGQTMEGICTAYSEAPRGDLLALVGSSGYLEIAVNQGSAAERLDVVVGDRVELLLGEGYAAVRY